MTKRETLKRTLWLILPLILLSSLFFPACLDKINLDIPSESLRGIVFQARLVKNEFGAEVSLKMDRLYNFAIPSIGPINALHVYLINEKEQKIALKRLGNGEYHLRLNDELDDFEVWYGQEFRMQIEMPDGRTFLSKPSKLHPVPKIDSVNLSFTNKFVPDVLDPELRVLDTFMAFSINTPVFIEGESERSRIRWQMERTWKVSEFPSPDPVNPRLICYITSPVSVLQPKTFDATLLEKNYLSDFLLFEEQFNHYFIEGYYLSIYQESLSEDAYQHFYQIEQSVQRTGNMFEPPAGSLVSNFENIEDPKDRVYGYFYATEADTFRQYVSPLYSNQDTFCLRTFDYLPDLCGDCLIEAGSDTVRPPWWREY